MDSLQPWGWVGQRGHCPRYDGRPPLLHLHGWPSSPDPLHRNLYWPSGRQGTDFWREVPKDSTGRGRANFLTRLQQSTSVRALTKPLTFTSQATPEDGDALFPSLLFCLLISEGCSLAACSQAWLQNRLWCILNTRSWLCQVSGESKGTFSFSDVS